MQRLSGGSLTSAAGATWKVHPLALPPLLASPLAVPCAGPGALAPPATSTPAAVTAGVAGTEFPSPGFSIDVWMPPAASDGS